MAMPAIERLTQCRFSDFQVNEIKEDGTVLHLQQVGLADEEAPVIRNGLYSFPSAPTNFFSVGCSEESVQRRAHSPGNENR